MLNTGGVADDPLRTPTGELFALVYDDLRRIARRQLGPGDTLNPTALVHELYLRMAEGASPRFGDPRQFFVYAARAMRHLLVDHARHRLRDKSGGRALHVDLDSINHASVDVREALELDNALRCLEQEDARAAQVVELHYFGGVALERIAELLGVVRRTVDRDLAFARAYLRTQG
ncbi:MAG: ECF-type sigma factor [Pseudomarimonas sp.]